MTCSKLASGRALLLGDAAHAISPNIGMGCIAALQDSEILARACIAADGDIEASAAQYNTDRLANAHALTLVSQQVDAVNTYQYHRNLVDLLTAFPYKLSQEAARLPASVPVPGALSCCCSRQAIHRSIARSTGGILSSGSAAGARSDHVRMHACKFTCM